MTWAKEANRLGERFEMEADEHAQRKPEDVCTA